MAGSWGQNICNAAGNGTYGPFDFPGGRAILCVDGVFGGSSSQLQLIGPAGTAINIGTAVTVAGQQLIELAPCSLQLAVTGGTGNAITATLSRVVQ